MANPRAIVRFDKLGADYATFKFGSTITYSATAADGSASTSLAVTMSADDTVDLCADGDTVVGKLIAVTADGFCTVQYCGGCTLPAGSGATVTAGKKIVGALGAAAAKGYIRNVATAATPTAAEVNEVAKARHLIVSAADTTAVAVILC